MKWLNIDKATFTKQMELENRILELVYHQDDYTTSDLQGVVSAIVMEAMMFTPKEKESPATPDWLIVPADSLK